MIVTFTQSCNTNENKFNEFNRRIENISLLTDSYKSDDNNYLKTLIDSIKIIQNEYSIIKIDTTFTNKLDNKIILISSKIKRKISQNCVLNRTFEIEIDNIEDGSTFLNILLEKIRLDFTFLKNNKCELRLYIKSFFENDWIRFNHFIKFKNKKKEDYDLVRFLNENFTNKLTLTNEDIKVLTNYEIYNDSTFKIKINDNLILLNVKDFNDCECDIIRKKS